MGSLLDPGDGDESQTSFDGLGSIWTVVTSYGSQAFIKCHAFAEWKVKAQRRKRLAQRGNDTRIDEVSSDMLGGRRNLRGRMQGG